MGLIPMIVAMDKHRAIGKDGNIPWAGKLRADMEHFKAATMGKTVVMGRKTWDSIPEKFRPFSGRENVILSRNPEYSVPDCLTLRHRDEVLRLVGKRREIVIIGGGEIYNLFLPYAHKIIVTHVNTVIDGDTFFPVLSEKWKFFRQVKVQQIDRKNEFSFSISEYISL